MTSALNASGAAAVGAAAFLLLVLAVDMYFGNPYEIRPRRWRPWAAAGAVVLVVVGTGLLEYAP